MENIKAEIKMSDLEKVDIRVGTIELVEDVPKSDKLVKLTVDFGTFKRTILVGLKKERENPGEVEGKQAESYQFLRCLKKLYRTERGSDDQRRRRRQVLISP